MLSIVLNVLFQIIPDNATSKYKLILLYITVDTIETFIFVIGRTDSHSLDTRLTLFTSTTVLAVDLPSYPDALNCSTVQGPHLPKIRGFHVKNSFDAALRVPQSAESILTSLSALVVRGHNSIKEMRTQTAAVGSFWGSLSQSSASAPSRGHSKQERTNCILWASSAWRQKCTNVLLRTDFYNSDHKGHSGAKFDKRTDRSCCSTCLFPGFGVPKMLNCGLSHTFVPVSWSWVLSAFVGRNYSSRNGMLFKLSLRFLLFPKSIVDLPVVCLLLAFAASASKTTGRGTVSPSWGLALKHKLPVCLGRRDRASGSFCILSTQVFNSSVRTNEIERLFLTSVPDSNHMEAGKTIVVNVIAFSACSPPPSLNFFSAGSVCWRTVHPLNLRKDATTTNNQCCKNTRHAI